MPEINPPSAESGSGLIDRTASLLYWLDHPNSLWQPQADEIKAPYLRQAEWLYAPWGAEEEGVLARPLPPADPRNACPYKDDEGRACGVCDTCVTSPGQDAS